MPLVDMSLEKLFCYEGTNPKPQDFDAYWERALEEMKATDPQVTLVPSSFQAPHAECFHLYFTGAGKSRIHAKFARPKNREGKCPAVLMFHGYGSHSGDWWDKLAYVGEGFCVAAMDCRGQAGKSEDLGSVSGTTQNGHIVRGLDDAPDKLLFKSVFLDTALLADIIINMPEVDEQRVGCIGGSQGGGLSLACASLEPRIKRAGSTFPFLSDYQRVWNMDLAAGAYAELKTYFRNFDPRHEREEEIFTRLGYIDIQYLVPRIKAEVFMATGLMDTICPPSTQFAAYNKITSKKEMKIYPDFGHESLPEFNDMVYRFIMGLKDL